MSKHKVLIADPIAEAGIEELKSDPALDVDVRIGIKEDELLNDAALYEAIIVRSQTKITEEVIEAAENLKIVGRAGVGVDNIFNTNSHKKWSNRNEYSCRKYHFYS